MRRSESIVLVTRGTRMEGLKRKRSTTGAARFVLNKAREHEQVRRAEMGDSINASAFAHIDSEAAFDTYEQEDALHQEALKKVRSDLDFGYPITIVDRERVPNYDFGSCLAVVVIGPDGLVANTAKYVGDIPIVAINPDATRNDGILLPFSPEDARREVKRVIGRRAQTRAVTLAEVSLNDGQRMLAFNDFFVGCRSHTSARYTLACRGDAEAQSSSGIIVSTGAGSTGWMSSVMRMATGVNQWLQARSFSRHAPVCQPPVLNWSERRLLWAVREPFVSRHSSADLVCGELNEGDELVLESLMPTNGVIFSDGIEDDYLEFTSGTVATIRVSSQAAHLVVPG